jgi:NitT/TauT family transport system substrate-binding protein
LVVAAAVGGEVVRPPAARALTRVRFTLPWIAHGGFTHVFVAKKLGFWERRGLDVSIDRGFGSGEVCKTLALGRHEFGEIDLGVMIKCVSLAPGLVAVANVSPRSPVGIFSLARQRIRRPQDLEGKRVAFSPGSGDFQLWPAFVRATGLDDAAVRKVLVGPEMLPQALLSGQVEAEGNFYGSIAPAVWASGEELAMMLYDDYGVHMYGLTIATRAELIREQPDLCRRFVEGALEGLRHVYLHPEEAIDLHLEMTREFAGSPRGRDVVAAGQGIMTAMGLVREVEHEGLGFMDPAMVRQTRDVVVAYMGAPKIVPVDEIHTNAFVGGVRLTTAEWAEVRRRVQRYMPPRP